MNNNHHLASEGIKIVKGEDLVGAMTCLAAEGCLSHRNIHHPAKHELEILNLVFSEIDELRLPN